MSADWTARLCVHVIGRGIIGVRSPWWTPPQWKFPGGRRKPEKDAGWKDTAIRATHRETGIDISRHAITYVSRNHGGMRPVYIGFVIVYDACDLAPLPGVEEQAKFFSRDELLATPDFLPAHRDLVQHYGLFT